MAVTPFGIAYPIRRLSHRLDFRCPEVPRQRWALRQSTIFTNPALREILAGEFLEWQHSCSEWGAQGWVRVAFQKTLIFCYLIFFFFRVVLYVLWGKQLPLYCTGGRIVDLDTVLCHQFHSVLYTCARLRGPPKGKRLQFMQRSNVCCVQHEAETDRTAHVGVGVHKCLTQPFRWVRGALVRDSSHLLCRHTHLHFPGSLSSD